MPVGELSDLRLTRAEWDSHDRIIILGVVPEYEFFCPSIFPDNQLTRQTAYLNGPFVHASSALKEVQHTVTKLAIQRGDLRSRQPRARQLPALAPSCHWKPRYWGHP